MWRRSEDPAVFSWCRKTNGRAGVGRRWTGGRPARVAAAACAADSRAALSSDAQNAAVSACARQKAATLRAGAFF